MLRYSLLALLHSLLVSGQDNGQIAQAPAVTAMAQRPRAFLAYRQEVAHTCGYFDADAAQPFTCDIGGACVSNTVDYIFGCCSTDSDGYFLPSACPKINDPYSSCVDYSNAATCTGDCYKTNLVCDSESPFCATAYSYTGREVYTRELCLSVKPETIFELYATAVSRGALTPTTTSSTTISDPTSSPTSRSSSTTQLGISTTPSPSPTPGTTAPSVTETITPTSSSKSNVGAIAGGVVGGIVGLALIIAGTIWYLRRAKKQERRSVISEVSQL